MRVYGALMWSMGKVMKTPEVLRVYVGSFWDQPLQYEDNAALFKMEESDLMRDLRDLPRNSAVRKINELVKRVRIGKVHAFIISYLREQMPMFMGRERKQKEVSWSIIIYFDLTHLRPFLSQLIMDLESVFRSVMKRYNLAPGDFPDINDFRSKLAEQDFTKFPALRPKLIEELEAVLGVDIPRLMEALPRSLDSYSNTSDIQANPALVYDDIKLSWGEEPGNPFGESAAVSNDIWGLEEYVSKYQDKFNEFQRNGAVAGAAARTVLKRPNVDVASIETRNEILRKRNT